LTSHLVFHLTTTFHLTTHRTKADKMPMAHSTLPQTARPVHRFTEFCPIAESSPVGLRDECVQTSLLCAQCQPIRAWLESNLHLLKQKRSIHTSLTTFKHHSSSRELEQANLQGCHLCTNLWTSFSETSQRRKRAVIAEQIREATYGPLVLAAHASNTSTSDDVLGELYYWNPSLKGRKTREPRVFLQLSTDVPSVQKMSHLCKRCPICAKDARIYAA
jgi:hypothetical protein